jgi:hypothetical protein
MKKRIATFVLALVLALSLGGTTALAATKPSMKLLSVSTTSIKRGKTIKWNYRLNSGSYKKKSGVYRAMFGTFICKGSVNGSMYAYKEILFSGKGEQGMKWKVPKSTPTGKYVNLYATYYRKNGSASWKCNAAKTKSFKIKK